MALYEYKIGATYAGMDYVENLGGSAGQHFAPEAYPIDYSEVVTLGNGMRRGLGWLTTKWHWGFLPIAQYNALKAFCAGLASQVYIKTRNNDGTFGVYTAIMLWPEKEPERRAGRVLDVTIEFTKLIAYTP